MADLLGQQGLVLLIEVVHFAEFVGDGAAALRISGEGRRRLPRFLPVISFCPPEAPPCRRRGGGWRGFGKAEFFEDEKQHLEVVFLPVDGVHLTVRQDVVSRMAVPMSCVMYTRGASSWRSSRPTRPL